MFVTLVLSDKIESIVVIVETHEGLDHQDKVRQVISMLDLLAVISFNLHVVQEELHVLLQAIVNETQLIERYEVRVHGNVSGSIYGRTVLIRTIRQGLLNSD